MSIADKVPWTNNLESKFDEIKQQLLRPRIVRLPDPKRIVFLETEGSGVAIDTVLKQRFDDTGLEHPMGFFSRALTGSETQLRCV